MIAISILASNDHKTNIEFLIIIFLFNKCFIESAAQLDTYLYIILDLNILFDHFVYFFEATFQSSQCFLGETY